MYPNTVYFNPLYPSLVSTLYVLSHQPQSIPLWVLVFVELYQYTLIPALSDTEQCILNTTLRRKDEFTPKRKGAPSTEGTASHFWGELMPKPYNQIKSNQID